MEKRVAVAYGCGLTRIVPAGEQVPVFCACGSPALLVEPVEPEAAPGARLVESGARPGVLDAVEFQEGSLEEAAAYAVLGETVGTRLIALVQATGALTEHEVQFLLRGIALARVEALARIGDQV